MIKNQFVMNELKMQDKCKKRELYIAVFCPKIIKQQQ